jgi:lauroyl/myristoyl acyltransferase
MTEDQSPDESAQDVERQRWPIGFMLLISVTALYLGWRLVQGIGALVGWITG